MPGTPRPWRLAMVDVDGTLRTAEDWMPGAFEMLQALADAGLSIAVCSGRPVHSLEGLFADLPMVERLCGAGGSVAKRRHPDGSWQVLLERHLDPAVVEDVANTCDRLGVEVWAYTAAEWLTCHFTDRTQREVDILGFSPTVVDSFIGRTDILKLLTLPTQPAQLAELERVCDRDGVTLVSSFPGYHDVVPTASLDTKGGDALIDDLGIDWSQVVAIGDGPNDVGMLGRAGLGICLPEVTASDVLAANPDAAHRLVEARDRHEVVAHLSEWLAG